MCNYLTTALQQHCITVYSADMLNSDLCFLFLHQEEHKAGQKEAVAKHHQCAHTKTNEVLAGVINLHGKQHTLRIKQEPALRKDLQVVTLQSDATDKLTRENDHHYPKAPLINTCIQTDYYTYNYT